MDGNGRQTLHAVLGLDELGETEGGELGGLIGGEGGGEEVGADAGRGVSV